MEIKGIPPFKREVYSALSIPKVREELINLDKSLLRNNSWPSQKDTVMGELSISLRAFLKDKGVSIDLEKLQRILLSINKDLKIELDDTLKIPIYKIIDIISREVLKQIPLEDIVDFKRALYEFLKRFLEERAQVKGLFLEKEV